MDLDSLSLFVEVARRGSFASVARDRGTEPSTISRVIAALEAELGFRLLQRTTRRMAPTEAGALYLQRVEQLVEDLDAARNEALAASAAPAGTLRLSASVAFGNRLIVPLLPAFRATYPQVSLDLVFTDSSLDLIAERIDLAIRLAPSVRADVICSKLLPTRYRVVASPAYLAGTPPLRRPVDLQQHPCLLFALPDFRSRWMFRDASGVVTEVPVAGPILMSNALALFTAALQGLGPALLPDWILAPDLASGALVDLFPGFDVAASSFDTAAWLIYPSRSYLPQKVRVAIDFLRAKVARR